MTAFRVRQEKFEGPLEALAELIEKEQLAISEVSLARVADEYLAYVRRLESTDPEELADSLVIAAQLMLIKSRSLLPGMRLSSEEEEAIGELEARLDEYRRYRRRAGELAAREALGMRMVSREAYVGLPPIFYPPSSLSAQSLEDAFRAALAAIPKMERLAEEKIRRIISLEDKIVHIREFVRGAMERGFSELVAGAQEKVEVIVSFLAILELARQRFVDLRQENAFGDIVIKKLS